LADIDCHLDINTSGRILGIKALTYSMNDQGFGRVGSNSSLVGLVSISRLSLYFVFKFAVRGFKLAVVAEHRQFGVKISVDYLDLVVIHMYGLQMAYWDKAKFFFSGVRKVHQPIDVTAALLRLMVKQKDMICILEPRGLLSKITGIWIAVGKLFRGKLGKTESSQSKNFMWVDFMTLRNRTTD